MTLQRLRNNKDLKIKPADKGGSACNTTKDYVSEAMRQLNNKEHYKPLPKDPLLK